MCRDFYGKFKAGELGCELRKSGVTCSLFRYGTLVRKVWTRSRISLCRKIGSRRATNVFNVMHCVHGQERHNRKWRTVASHAVGPTSDIHGTHFCEWKLDRSEGILGTVEAINSAFYCHDTVNGGEALIVDYNVASLAGVPVDRMRLTLLNNVLFF